MNNREVDIEMDAEQRLCKIMLMVKNIRPFYCAVFQVMEKVETPDIPTAAVNIDSFLYNKDFVESITMPELLFVVLHEIAHVALMHVARCETRDPTIWNLACDLYVNALLAEEFRLYPNGVTTIDNGYQIQMLENIVFSPAIDVDKEAAETIYEELEKQTNKNGYNGGNDGESFTFRVSRDKGDYSFKVTKGSAGDLVDSSSTASDQLQKDAIARKIVTDAVTREEMMNGESSDSYGRGSANLLRKAKEMLKSRIDWKRLLKKYLVEKTSKESSFLRPDKRMSYMQAIYPGQASISEKELDGVKVCIDTSGSISDTDLKYFFGQVYDITKNFKLKAELVYWDDTVQSTCDFEGYEEFSRQNCMGYGGTNPVCIFDYFESKKCKQKPIVTLVFTDGFFNVSDLDNEKLKKKYKHTIWVMTREHNKGFDPPFGRVAYADFSKSK